MADATVDPTTATKTAPKPKAAAKKTAAKKTTAKKAAAKKTTAKRKTTRKTTAKKKAAAKQDFRTTAVETSRNAFRAGLGIYGKAYDQMLDQFETVQKQVDEAQNTLNDRREQAEELYESLVKRGETVEQDALKAIEDIEIGALTDRVKLEEQMNRAKARFEELRDKLMNLG